MAPSKVIQNIARKHSGLPAGVLGNGGFMQVEVTFGLRSGCLRLSRRGCWDDVRL
jgi:hypothetical protein